MFVAGALVGLVASPAAGAPASGAFAALFLAAPTANRLRLGDIRDAAARRRAYVFTFRPGQWFQQRS
ncbi:hypothetical protein AB0M61_07195 [Streptomyces sp. NPDC051642]|uniref:hypothetical protein n=1 Tax=Streptomyces sp. NPDC051642 TaxID=3154646 RepID=UPI00342FAD32